MLGLLAGSGFQSVEHASVEVLVLLVLTSKHRQLASLRPLASKHRQQAELWRSMLLSQWRCQERIAHEPAIAPLPMAMH